MANRPTTPSIGETAIGSALLLAILAALYLLPASSLGFWEPWETSLASLGRQLGESPDMDPFRIVRGGDVVLRPWLEAYLLRLGHGLGGELGYRLPFTLLNLFAALFTFGTLSRLFGTIRAFLAALAFGIAPAVVLSSASLAGDAVGIAPITVATVALGSVAARRGEGAAWMLPIGGVALALCVWGHGVLGFAVPIGTMAVFSAGTLDDRSSGGIVLAGLVGAVVTLLVGVGLPGMAVLELGWDTSKDLFGVGIAVALPLALLLGTAPRSRARHLLDPIGAPIAVLLFAGLIAWPLSSWIGQEGWAEALLYRTPLNRRMLPDHVTFDQLIRLVGASVYPMTLLVPLGFAYLVRTARGDERETNDDHDDARAFKQLLVLWMGVGFAVLGLSASLAHVYLVPAVLPLCAGSALALTDDRWLKSLSLNRIVFHTIGLVSLLLLLVTSKDMRGTYDLELGRPGPHFFFEFLLLDGDVAFPDDYAFRAMSLFVLGWGAIVVLFFADPLGVLRGWRDGIRRIRPGTSDDAGRVRRWYRRSLEGGFLGTLRSSAERSVSLIINVVERAWNRATGGGMGNRITAVAFSLLALGWMVEVVMHDLPNVTNHFSQKGLLTTFEELAPEGTPLYTAGISDDDQSYYMTGTNLEPLARIEDLRGLFCEAEGPVFAVLPFGRLAEAHYEVRHAVGGRRGEVEDGENCEAGLDFYVVDGRSNRYVLVSNVLPEGREDESVIGEHVFAPDALPPEAEEPAEVVTVDGKLRLVAVELQPREIDSGDLTVAAYWEVLERPSSNYEVFIHVDRGGNRLNGDHDTVGGHYPMRYWVPGEVVRDSFVIDVSRADAAGVYIAWYGFFRGDDRLVVDPPRSDNRVNLGEIRVR